MAPTVETAAGNVADYLPDELAPLLTLFGEQVTKQFLSVSLGWADNVLLAAGPVGIMTIMVSTIRVKQELLSSTSENVCELWSGQSVVRMIGNTHLKDLFIDKEGKLYDLEQALETKKIICRDLNYNNDDQDNQDKIAELGNGRANLTLNVKRLNTSNWETRLLVSLAILAQVSGLVFPTLATYYWRWEDSQYGHTCFLVGSTLVVGGVLVCGHIIESVTTEHEFRPNPTPKDGCEIVEAIRVQCHGYVGNQHFNSYLIKSPLPPGFVLITSRVNDREYRWMTIFAVSTTAIGFLSQFVGLRALHWSVTFFQLGITLVMTCIRALARRGLSSKLDCERLNSDYERESVTLRLLQMHGKTLPRENGNNPFKSRYANPSKSKIRPPSSKSSYEPFSERRSVDTKMDLSLELMTAGVFFTQSTTYPWFTGSFDDDLHHIIDRRVPIYLHLNPEALPPRIVYDSYYEHDTKYSDDPGIAMRTTKIFRQLSWETRRDDCQGVETRYCSLIEAMEEFARVLDTSQDILWKGDKFPWTSDGKGTRNLSWKFDVFTGALEEDGRRSQITLSMQHDGKKYSVSHDSHGLISQLLQLCSYGLQGRIGGKLTTVHDNLGRKEGASWEEKGAMQRDVSQIVPVFGMFLSCQADLPNPQHQQKASSNHSSQRNRVADTNHYDPDQKHCGFYRFDLLEKHILLEIMSVFLLAIVSEVKEVRGRTSFKEPSTNGGGLAPGPIWQNSVFDELAGVMVSTGLVQYFDDALSFVIPPFMRYNLLPTNPDNLAGNGDRLQYSPSMTSTDDLRQTIKAASGDDGEVDKSISQDELPTG
ncbi:hypothetical protein G7046_g989 [Stylonectria norvegica]|nr:hypothetical protein G7046_g989 [Stylonectria norvegica]